MEGVLEQLPQSLATANSAAEAHTKKRSLVWLVLHRILISQATSIWTQMY